MASARSTCWRIAVDDQQDNRPAQHTFRAGHQQHPGAVLLLGDLVDRAGVGPVLQPAEQERGREGRHDRATACHSSCRSHPGIAAFAAVSRSPGPGGRHRHRPGRMDRAGQQRGVRLGD